MLKEFSKDTAKSMSSLISSSRKYRISFSCLVYVIIVVSFRIPTMSWDQGPYEFAVSGAGDDYIDLANTYPFVEAQIMDDDDTALDGGADLPGVSLYHMTLVN
jgi:hypothetical protein